MLQYERNLLCATLLALMCCSAIRAQQEQQPQTPPPATIHVDVARVNVGAIVTDKNGKFVEGLRREDFHAFDNNSEQPITEFAPIDEPAQVLMLIEAGPAVYLLQDAHLLAADALLNGLSPGDHIAIARYADSPEGLLNFTTDKGVALGVLDQIQFILGFAQLNLSSSLNTVMDWLAQVPGKKTVVLLSTGVDTSPAPIIQALRTRLQLGDVRILAISMSGPLRNGKQGSKQTILRTDAAFAAADANLQSIAESTGGRAYFPQNPKAFQEAYKQIAELVRHEYSLSFAPPVADGAVHSINLTVKFGDERQQNKDAAYRIDHRKAYRAPAP
jgi:Ca-activated chloride channel homolog